MSSQVNHENGLDSDLDSSLKTYKVMVTPDAKADLRRYLAYLRNNLKNRQAAKNVSKDYRKTKKSLETSAGSLKEPENEALKKRGLKRIDFHSHEYCLLYRIKGNIVEVTNMFHQSEDIENKLR